MTRHGGKSTNLKRCFSFAVYTNYGAGEHAGIFRCREVVSDRLHGDCAGQFDRDLGVTPEQKSIRK